MNTELDLPETLTDAVAYFSDKQRALVFMIALRWPDGVVTCRCGSAQATWMPKHNRWRCRECNVQFSVKAGTVFEDSPLPLSKWLPAVWCIANAKNGISSCELARALGVTQKTAWFMLHRIRVGMQDGGFVKDKFSGPVQVDESWIGGSARNMHKKAKKRRGVIQGSSKHLTPVMGLLDRKTRKIVAQVVPDVKAENLMPLVRKYVLKGSELHSDMHAGYKPAIDEYDHKVIDHAICYAKDGVSTNGLENFWSLLKRTIKGTYVSVEPFHLFRYLSEQVFRFNQRKDEDGDRGRFLTAMAGIIGKRLTYKKLIGADDAGLPATA